MPRACTRPLRSVAREGGLEAFLGAHEASLVVVAGPGAGRELRLDRPRLHVGRGSDADLRIEDDAVSHDHALLEFAGERFRIRDLESTNGTWVNGERVREADLEHGDRVGLGEHVLRYVLVERRREPRVHVLPGA